MDKFLSDQSTFRIGGLSFLLVAIVAGVDFATGYEASFSIFYIVPVSISSWYVGKRFGVLFSIVSATAWFAADYYAGHRYSHPTIPYWNAIAHLSYFVVIDYLLDRLRVSLDCQKLLAQQDGLTGIMNARTFKQKCDSTFAIASRHGRPLALGYLDLDGFKGVNDSLGHNVGDQVLKAVAAELTKRLRASDFGGRLGGDEFAILLPETDLPGAQKFFTKLRKDLIELAALNRWPVGFSIGVAVFHTPTANPDDAIRFADGLMYKVKNSGKNNILFEHYSSASRNA